MELPREFVFSEKLWRQRMRTLLKVLPFGVAATSLYALIISDFAFAKVALALGVTFAVAGLIFAIELPILMRIIRNVKVQVTEGGVSIDNGKSIDTIEWENITLLRVKRRPSGEVNRISLLGRDRRRRTLHALEDMDALTAILAKMAINAETEDSRYICDWDDWRLGAATAVATVAVFTVFHMLGKDVLELFIIAFALTAGAGMSFYHPMGSSNRRLALFEQLLAWLLIGGGLGCSLRRSSACSAANFSASHPARPQHAPSFAHISRQQTFLIL